MHAKGAGPAVARGDTADSTRNGPSVTRPRELLHFLLLDRDQQAQAIRRLSAQGMSDHTIATATRLSIDMVRRILMEAYP